MSALLAVVGLSLLFIGHECGHYVVARACGIRIERFRLGFGPVLLERTSPTTGTRFQLAVLPFGASVKIRGMNVAGDIDPGDCHAYPNRPGWQRLVTILAGPATNYLLAGVLGMVFYACHGIEVPRWYGIGDVLPGYDAHGKLEPGDRIVAVDHSALYIDSGPSLIERVNASRGAPITLTIERGGKSHDVQVTPHDDGTGSATRWRLGVRPVVMNLTIELGALDAAGRALTYPFTLTRTIVTGLYRIVFGSEETDLGGPVRMVEEFSRARAAGWPSVLTLLMLLNVYVGLFQLLPFPGLDGARLAVLAYQIATRRRAKPAA